MKHLVYTTKWSTVSAHSGSSVTWVEPCWVGMTPSAEASKHTHTWTAVGELWAYKGCYGNHHGWVLMWFFFCLNATVPGDSIEAECIITRYILRGGPPLTICTNVRVKAHTGVCSTVLNDSTPSGDDCWTAERHWQKVQVPASGDIWMSQHNTE